MSNVYVATKAENYPRAREVMKALDAAGHRITHDWTQAVEAFKDTPASERHTEVSQRHAREDLTGVIRADVYVLIPYANVTGALIEFGAAVTSGSDLYFLGPVDRMRYSIFYELVPETNWLTDDDYGVQCLIADLDRVERPVRGWDAS